MALISVVHGLVLACISHTPSAAAADMLVVARAAPSRRLDLVSATPAPSLSPPHAPRRHLGHLATNGHEKCRLAPLTKLGEARFELASSAAAEFHLGAVD